MGLEQKQALLHQSMIFPVGVILSAYPSAVSQPRAD
jgi:hypothetical protein